VDFGPWIYRALASCLSRGRGIDQGRTLHTGATRSDGRRITAHERHYGNQGIFAQAPNVRHHHTGRIRTDKYLSYVELSEKWHLDAKRTNDSKCARKGARVLCRNLSLEEVRCEEVVAIALRERGGDLALSAGGHGAGLHTRQGKHDQPYPHCYGGYQPAAPALLSPLEKNQRSFTRYILRSRRHDLGASTLHLLLEKNWRSSIS
jgi:hypothetical protein